MKTHGYAHSPVKFSDLRFMARKSCRLKLFDGRVGKVEYPYFAYHKTLVFENGRKEISWQYDLLEDVFEQIHFIHVDSILVAERRLGEKVLKFTGKGYQPARFVKKIVPFKTSNN